jgi:hypothetical protein
MSLLAFSGVAAAAPPEGCVGLPSTPQAYACVTEFTPTGAVPTVTPGPGQTVTVPEACVFVCAGPTPVTVPGVTVTRGGSAAVVTYNGWTYPVTAWGPGSEFSGGCDFRTVRQDTVTGDRWVGEWSVFVIATDGSADKVPDPTASITDVRCEFYVSYYAYTDLTAPDGIGVTASGGTFEIPGPAAGNIVICTNATINGTAFRHCVEPDEVRTPTDVADTVVDILNDNVFSQLDPTICAGLLAAAPFVNGLGQYETVYIDASDYQRPDGLNGDYDGNDHDGDVFVGGELTWDCPPYT